MSEALMINDAAKQLQIGSKKFRDLLRKKGFLAPGTNFPRDQFVKAGYFTTEPRSCTIKRPGDSTGRDKLYYVTLITAAGMKHLQPIVDEYKATITPAPRRVKITIEIFNPEFVHALIRYATLMHQFKHGTITEDERAELDRARRAIVTYFPMLGTASLERLNKKLFTHPKFQTVFQSQDPKHTH